MTSQTKKSDFFLEKISNKDVDYIDIIGLNVALLYSKEIFKKNEDISKFLKTVYNIDFLPYVMKSRTTIVARITRELNNKNDSELNEIRKRIIIFLNEDKAIPDHKKNYKKKDSNEKLKTWLEGF
ncbi:hypothetical protein [Peribacillus frigoritolerans]|uniref:hypothetical protein n=1 Tax=Peribacillus frigoritolerans TaxID=450367 RepID=UPI003018A9D4